MKYTRWQTKFELISVKILCTFGSDRLKASCTIKIAYRVKRKSLFYGGARCSSVCLIEVMLLGNNPRSVWIMASVHLNKVSF